MFDRGVIIACAALLLPSSATAQDWRTVTSTRQPAGESAFQVEVEYGAGELTIAPADQAVLYRSTLRYDADSFRPVTTFSDGRLQLGIEGGRNLKSLKGNNKARLDLRLGSGVPVDLDLQFGAVEADLELGGLRIRSLDVSTGASETRLRFSKPNLEQMRLMNFEAGAAEFRAEKLGNANAERFDFDGGVGDITLDFTGEWRRDMTASIDMGIGSLTLVLPSDLGVRIQKETFLTSFDSQGLTKRGNYYYSEKWDSAAHKLTISIDAAFGSIDVRWIDAVAVR